MPWSPQATVREPLEEGSLTPNPDPPSAQLSRSLTGGLQLCSLTQGRLSSPRSRPRRLGPQLCSLLREDSVIHTPDPGDWTRTGTVPQDPPALCPSQWSSVLSCEPPQSQTLGFHGGRYHHCCIRTQRPLAESGLVGRPHSRSRREVDLRLESRIPEKAHAVFILQHGLE